MTLWTLALLLAPRQEVDKGDVDPTAFVIPPDFALRARVAAAAAPGPFRIRWRYGGEGLGGSVTSGVLGEKAALGAWTEPLPLLAFAKKFPKRLFLTVTVDPSPQGLKMEVDFLWRGKSLKTVEEAGPDGGTVGLYIPAYRLGGNKPPDHPDFLRELGGISGYVRERADRLEKLGGGARPSRYMVVTDLGGYGAGTGYGIRHTNPSIVETEIRALRQLGVNALRGRPGYLDAGNSPFAKGVIGGVGGFPIVKKTEPGGGCPHAPAVEKLAQAQAARALDQLKSPYEEVWLLTVDEIGTVFGESPEGKWKHAPACAACTAAYQDWLRKRGLTPADFGKSAWAEVRPVDPAGAEPMAAYHTAIFGTVATAKLFTPLREAVARANAAKAKDPSLKQPWLYSYALRGNTFLMGGASLDFFEFYRHADNAFVYETSNRDPRIWGWDSYLCDVGRVVSADQGLRFGVYVKPHRGAPVQRMLAAASRNARMIYWYTYGPDYHKGDSFSEKPEALELVTQAARILGRSEDVLYGSSWVKPAEVAIVNPTSSERWMGLGGPAPAKEAAWENAKWIYSALQHAHIPVDPLDEAMLATADLSRYKVLYVNGPHLTRAAAEKVAAWVGAGGTLYTSGGGLLYDEAHRPLKALEPVLGLQPREAPRMSFKVALYGATRIESFDDRRRHLEPPPPGVVGAGPFAGAFPLTIGRETLKPSTAQVLAKFEDGLPAVTRNAHGRGQAYVVAFFPGLEYSALVRPEAFDMSKGFLSDRRSWIVAPALEKTAPVVDASAPAVEGVLLRNGATGKLAVTLANWAYRAAPGGVEIVPLSGLKVSIRGAEGATKARSAALDQPLAAEAANGALVVTLPSLAEGDVLLLE